MSNAPRALFELDDDLETILASVTATTGSLVLARGRRGLWRVRVAGDRIAAADLYDSASALIADLTGDDRAALGLDADRIEALEALEALAAELDRGELGAALDRGRDVLARLAERFAVDLDRAPGDGMLGRPVIADPSQLAELARRALERVLDSPLGALGRARQVVDAIAEQLGEPRSRREPVELDRFFDAAIEPAALRALVDGMGEPPEPDPSLGFLNQALRDGGVDAESIFGPRSILRCRCGKLQGDAARGERCDSCGVLCDDRPHREVTPGALWSSFGLVHPAMVPAIAAALESGEDQLRALAASDEPDAGPIAVADALGERAAELLIRAVPVLPPGDRPTLRMLEDGATTEIDHPITAAYHALLSTLCSVDRVIDLDGPDIIVRSYAGRAQRAFDRLWAAVIDPAPVSRLDGWGVRPEPGATGAEVALSITGDDEPDEPDDPDETQATMLWLTSSTAVIKRRGTAAVIDLDRREVIHRFAVGAARLQACDGEGRLVLASAESGFFEDDVLCGFGCYDLATGAWLETLPRSIPAVTFGKPYEPEDGVLYELGRGDAISIDLGDRPTALAWSRGNRAVLVSGDYASSHGAEIRSTTSGLVALRGCGLDAERWDCPMLGPGGDLDDDPSDERDEEINEAMAELWESRYMEPRPAAIARHRTDRWRLLTPDLVVATAAAPLFSLGFAVEAASFDTAAERLLLLTPNELIELEIDPPRVVRRSPHDGLIGPS
jgi:hypothetical protein